MLKLLLSFICCLCFSSLVFEEKIDNTTNQLISLKTRAENLLSDNYGFSQQKLYDERRKVFLEYCSSKASTDGRNGIFPQIARLALGLPLDDRSLKASIDFVYSNRDCNDFTVGGLLRILYLYPKSPLVSEKQKRDIEKCLLDFKYWWNEPGSDSRCYHTENHQIIFHSDQLLAGQLFKDRTFSNSDQNGVMHMQYATTLINRWLNWRIKFGFSEWLSNNYFDADCLALANLFDFAEDPTIRQKTGILIDVLMFEMALHSFHGTFGSTHGRAYAPNLKGGRNEPSANTINFMFGMDNFNQPRLYNASSMGAVSLATSSYRCPEIIQRIATDFSIPIRIRERHSINIDDAFNYGLSYCKESDINLYWSIQDYTHPAILDLSQQNANRYRIRLHGDYDKYRYLYQQQIQKYGQIVNSKLNPKALTEVNIETYRTPDFMLSCAQQFRPGCLGYQQHIWQATLGIDAVVFTTHPGSLSEGSRPDYWAGNGILPNAAQYKNVVVCIYNIPEINPLLFHIETKVDSTMDDNILPGEASCELLPLSHAYFPKAAFDEVVEKGHWVFGRKDNGYIALFSQNPTRWKDDGGIELDLIASGRNNIWICELGSKDTWGSFSRFIAAITRYEVECKGLNVRYNSPSLGEIKYGWSEPFQVKNEIISLRDYLRFDNPYCQNDFASEKIVINDIREELILDFKNAKREVIKLPKKL